MLRNVSVNRNLYQLGLFSFKNILWMRVTNSLYRPSVRAIAQPDIFPHYRALRFGCRPST